MKIGRVIAEIVETNISKSRCKCASRSLKELDYHATAPLNKKDKV
jgi:hypothetical protein